MPLTDYLAQTQTAIEQLLRNLDYYQDLWEKVASSFLDASREFDFIHASDPDIEIKQARQWRASEGARADHLAAVRENNGVQVSLNAISGAILQIAFMGIKLYSRNQERPRGFEQLSLSQGQERNLIRFGGGRLIRGVPLGLVVFLGRSQYNHLDEDRLYRLNEEICERLKQYDPLTEDFYSIASDEARLTFARNIITLLGWQSYEDYASDMREVMEDSGS